jgi:hypothetical protein
MAGNGNGNGDGGNGDGLHVVSFQDKQASVAQDKVALAEKQAAAARQHAMKCIEELYKMAQAGKLLDIAFIATSSDNPGQYIWAISRDTDNARMIGHVSLLLRYAQDRALVK